MTTAYITHLDCTMHNTGDGHPESSDRLRAIDKHLRESTLWPHLVKVSAPMATPAQLKAVHSSEYVDRVHKLFPLRQPVHLDGDTTLSEFSLDASLRAAGAVIRGVDLVMSGSVSNAFCAVRPPGHHACSSKAMGFCVFNNIAVAAAHAINSYRLRRVLIIDFDVHHGNGTEDIFADQADVLMCGFFQSPLYPGSGGLHGASNMVNCPLPAGATQSEIKQAIENYWLQAIDDFNPDLVLVSAGFDAHVNDPLAALCLNSQDYQWLTEFCQRVADTYCQGRLVSSLEGGYQLEALAESVYHHVNALISSH